jgi:universal stress protein A
MLSIKKILSPTDFSDASLVGLAAAVDLARLFQAELLVANIIAVLPPQPSDPNFEWEVPEYESILHKDAEVKLAELIKTAVPAGITARSILGHGHPAKEIIRIAEEEKVEMVVIATHGHTGWHHLLLGSVAEKVIRHSPCPVLAVREQRS